MALNAKHRCYAEVARATRPSQTWVSGSCLGVWACPCQQCFIREATLLPVPRNTRWWPSVGALHTTDLPVFSLMVLMSRQELSRLSHQTATPAVLRQVSPGKELIMNTSAPAPQEIPAPGFPEAKGRVALVADFTLEWEHSSSAPGAPNEGDSGGNLWPVTHRTLSFQADWTQIYSCSSPPQPKLCLLT